MVETRGKVWTVVYCDGEPAAWCSSVVEHRDGARVLVCGDGFERPGFMDRC
ncbi:hypothetical protein [Catenuloplanes atrovinosus]|uniref:Uncharacterized protein n=1 Tax=Catenuloplanes atrovinosus TaxID=137266 RepID=A0AAE3YS31_9ACTN|nr:hypothetical protein [Catenuloplanes atrovinosus]MDR7277630.1 hypothetical protein [Catenuloplanes atrovinosus]